MPIANDGNRRKRGVRSLSGVPAMLVMPAVLSSILVSGPYRVKIAPVAKEQSRGHPQFN